MIMSTAEQLKLPKRLNHDFGRMVMDRFRDWEKAERKLAARCRARGKTPTVDAAQSTVVDETRPD